MKYFSKDYLEGIVHEFFASVGKTVASAAVAYLAVRLANVHIDLMSPNADVYGAAIVLLRALLSSAKVYVDNMKIDDAVKG